MMSVKPVLRIKNIYIKKKKYKSIYLYIVTCRDTPDVLLETPGLHIYADIQSAIRAAAV